MTNYQRTQPQTPITLLFEEAHSLVQQVLPTAGARQRQEILFLLNTLQDACQQLSAVTGENGKGEEG